MGDQQCMATLPESCLISLQKRHPHREAFAWGGACSPSNRGVGMRWWWGIHYSKRRETVPLTDLGHHCSSRHTHDLWESAAPASSVDQHAAHVSVHDRLEYCGIAAGPKAKGPPTQHQGLSLTLPPTPSNPLLLHPSRLGMGKFGGTMAIP